MPTAAIVTALQVYAIAVAISVLVALLIKAMVWFTGRLETGRKVNVPLGTVCPVGPGIPEEDVAALSAAIFIMIGPHHVLHIAPKSRHWASDTRAAQHSHKTDSR